MSTLLDRPAGQAPGPAVDLGDADLPDLQRLVDRDPLVNVVLAARLRAVGRLDAQRLGGRVLGVRDASGLLTAAAFAGPVLLPVGGTPGEWEVLADALGRAPRPCTSIVGRAPAVRAMWAELESRWGPARLVRRSQCLVTLDSDVALPLGDPRVRQVRTAELETYLPAAAAMFTEELGVTPYGVGGVGDYRRRVRTMLNAGRAYAIVDDAGRDGPRIVFKADLGAASAHTVQLQGVWTHPDLRGRGIAGAALPVVLREALRLAPSVSLYVNDFNIAARRLYARLGMREAAELSTVLF